VLESFARLAAVVARRVEVQLKHVGNVGADRSQNTHTHRYRIWTEPAARPSGDDPAQGRITCGDCDTVVTYRLWPVEKTRRRRRLWGVLALASLAALVVSVSLLVTGSLGGYGLIVPIVASNAVFGFGITAGAERGIRSLNPARPDGRPVPRHTVNVKDADDPT
jgi:hypothetical protein